MGGCREKRGARDARVVEERAFGHITGLVEEARDVLIVREIQARRHGGRDLGEEGVHGGAVEVSLVEVRAHAVLFEGEHLRGARVLAAIFGGPAEVVGQA